MRKARFFKSFYMMKTQDMTLLNKKTTDYAIWHNSRNGVLLTHFIFSSLKSLTDTACADYVFEGSSLDRTSDAQCLILFAWSFSTRSHWSASFVSLNRMVAPFGRCWFCIFIIDVTSRGYNFVIGRFVCPVVVLMFAERIKPSLPTIKHSTTAILQLTRLVSWCTCTASPTLIFVSFLLEVFLNSTCTCASKWAMKSNPVTENGGESCSYRRWKWC